MTMAASRRTASLLRAFRSISKASNQVRIVPAYFNVRHNSQHRVIILPEVPRDTPETNPMLYRYTSSKFPDFSHVTEKDCFYALGKSLMEYEAEVVHLEERCKQGIMDFDELLGPMEAQKCQLETVWSMINLMLLVTDKLDKDRFLKLHDRASRALSSRLDSSTIYKHFKTMKEAHTKQPFLNPEQETMLQKFMVELEYQGHALGSEKKFEELHENWYASIRQSSAEYNWRMRLNTDRYQHTIVNPDIVRDFPIDLLKAMAHDGTQPSRGPWTNTLHPYIFREFLAHCPDRHLRYAAYYAYVSRGSKETDHDTNILSHVSKLRQMRLDMAICMGYKSYVAMTMEHKMASSLESVRTLIKQLAAKAKERQEVELENIQTYAESRGFDEEIQFYDLEYFKRRQRKTILGMSDEDMRDFFPLPKVLAGLSELCSRLFDVEIQQVTTDGKTWHSDTHLWSVKDIPSGKVLGHFYLDAFIRQEKGYAGGDFGWYMPIRPRSKFGNTTPLGAMVFSLTPPNVGKPSLLNFSETKEVFRNFGNMLQHILSENEYSDSCGKASMEKDALDFVGHFMSSWMHHPEVIKSVSGHWSNNQGLRDEVIDHLCTSIKHHMTGYELCNELYLAEFDLLFHSDEPEHHTDVEENLRKEYHLLPKIKGDIAPFYHSDIIGGELSANKYASIWSKMMAADAFSAIEEVSSKGESVFESESVKGVTRRFRDTVLATGSGRPSTEIFRKFRGRDPSHEALLHSLGLVKTPENVPHRKNPSVDE